MKTNFQIVAIWSKASYIIWRTVLIFLLLPFMEGFLYVDATMASSLLVDHGMNIRTPRNANKVVRLDAARNEYEPYILLADISLGEEGFYSIQFENLKLVANETVQIKKSFFEVFKVEDVEAELPVDPTYWTKRKLPPGIELHATLFPDKLLPVSQVSEDFLFRGRTIFWVNIYVPEKASPGIYSGSIIMRRKGKSVAYASVELNVWDFTLPRTPSFGFMADLPRGKSAPRYPSPYYLQAVDNMARHLCSVRSISPSPSIKFNDDVPVIDFSEYDKAVEHLLNEMGMTITQFPRVQIFNGHGKKIVDIFGPASESGLSTEFCNKFEKSVALIGQHLAERGSLSKNLFIFFDEPPPKWYSIVRNVADLTVKADRRLRPSVYGSNPRPELEGYIRDWIGRPEGKHYNHEYRLKRQQMGDRYGTYNHWESFGLGVSPVFTRELFWWAWKEKIDYMVLYTIGSWRRARKCANEFWDMVVYPTVDAPFDGSVRWEMIREGLEDYEYLTLLEKILESDRNNKDIRDLCRDAAGLAGTLYERNLNSLHLLSLRGKMGQAIAALKGRSHE